jgi:hypothetical protein
MINRKCIPSTVKLKVCNSAQFLTTQGEFMSVHTVKLQDICLPAFSFSRRFKTIKAYVFNAPHYPYDLLLGHKFIKQAKMKMDFDTGQTAWLGSVVPKLHLFLEHESVRSDIAES